MSKLTLYLGKYFGVPLYLHWSTVIFLSMMLIVDSQTALVIGMAYFFVILHEYGHIVAAIVRGQSCCKVTIYPIGGLAEIDLWHTSNTDEFVITVCGPAVNLALAMLFSPLFVFFQYMGWRHSTAGVEMAIYINMVLFAFNMLPAWPMDGGRLFRSVLTCVMNKYVANEIAVFTSIGLAGAGIVFALVTLHLNLLITMPLIIVMALQEWRRYRKMAVLEQIQDGVKDAIHGDFKSVLLRVNQFKRPQDMGQYLLLVNNWDKLGREDVEKFISRPPDQNCEEIMMDLLTQITRIQCRFINEVYLALEQKKSPVEVHEAIMKIPDETLRTAIAAEWRRLHPN